MILQHKLMMAAIALLALAFLLSSVNKVLYNHSFERALKRSPVVLSRVQTKAALVLVPATELLLALGVLVRPLRRWVLYLMLFMLTLRSTLRLAGVLLGLNVTHGCCGKELRPVGYWLFAMDTGMILIILWLLLAVAQRMQERR